MRKRTTESLAKGVQPSVFYFFTKGKLGWSGSVINLDMQVECMQVEANEPCGRGLLFMSQKRLCLVYV